jgi:hypothetical protein
MLIFSYIYRKIRKKRKVKEESNTIIENELIKNEIKYKMCDMVIIGEDEIGNIKKMSYTSLLELHLLMIKYSNYMIEFIENENES